MRPGKAHRPQSVPLSGVGAMIALSFLRRLRDSQGSLPRTGGSEPQVSLQILLPQREQIKQD